jgi:hypothetical protein
VAERGDFSEQALAYGVVCLRIHGVRTLVAKDALKAGECAGGIKWC